MMAISPDEFARTAWFREDFGKAPLTGYLGILARHPEGALVSTAFFENEKLSLGDRVTFSYKEQTIESFIAGTVSYWPSLDPLRQPFFILNLDWVQECTRLEPYDVWYRLDELGRVQELVDGLNRLGIWPTKVLDADAMITELRQEPYRMGFFGILSMGFIVSALVTALGFLVSTYFSIRGRLVQLGALRSMGFSGVQLLAHLGLEQLLTLGLGLGAGTGLGFLCSRLFLPFLRDRASEVQKFPPFLVVIDRADAVASLLVLSALFVAAVALLALGISRTRVNRAIRMGEDL
jgi:putative ABC transport system permease protein